MSPWIPEDLRRILVSDPAFANSYLVGGCVRDACLGLPVKDYDVEVFGLRVDQLQQALTAFGKVDAVGRSFGVLKLTTKPGCTYDFSLPRRDSKIGAGHRGFDIECDPDLPLAEATARRDFTINAVMYDPRRAALLDFHGGLEDLRQRVLRHTSAAFSEDPLRVLRGMQFVSRFELEAHPSTIAACQAMRSTYGELAVERVREEWYKWATLSRKPSLGLEFLRATGWLEHSPELNALVSCAQDPTWHPEGTVWTHTGHCCDALVSLPSWSEAIAEPERRLIWMFAVLCHDLGKPVTTRSEERDGRMRIVSPGHDVAGVPLTRALLSRWAVPEDIQDRVARLVLHHMSHMQSQSPRAVRRLARALWPETIENLATVITSDAYGRPPKPREAPAALAGLLEQAAQMQLANKAPKPILLGRHLVPYGFQPGKELGEVLRAAMEAQLEGAFEDLPGAMAWLRERHPTPPSPNASSADGPIRS